MTQLRSSMNLNFYSLIILLSVAHLCMSALPRNYKKLRQDLIDDEVARSFGGKIILTTKEQAANSCLMNLKITEVDKAFKDPEKFLPSKYFPFVRKKIEKSQVFKIIRKMPKGSLFHAHITAGASFDFIIKKLSYLPNLYICQNGDEMRFQFTQRPEKDCNWKLLADERKKNPNIDDEIMKKISVLMDVKPNVKDNDVWNTFEEIFKIVKGIIKYRPAFELYIKQVLQETYDDNIMYVEFRSSLSKLYELDGSVHRHVAVAGIYQKVINEFTMSHPGFIGAKMIYSANRKMSNKAFDDTIKFYRETKSAYPNWIIGFDLVGQEDKGETLQQFIDKLEELSKDTNFYFHAGETNWYGHSTDMNLYDAVLLSTKRIGHGLALLKHPKLMEMVKSKNIAIELNPISNQVLEFVDDMRNHPASYFFAENFPIVVSSDDPSFWGASGLSYDFYEAFVGIMSRSADLRALKQLALNSIEFSTMNDHEKKQALDTWKTAWNTFIDDLANHENC